MLFLMMRGKILLRISNLGIQQGSALGSTRRMGHLRPLRPPRPSFTIVAPSQPPLVVTTIPTHTQTLPTISLSSPATESQLLSFLKAHLSLPITPGTLLHFLKNKLHYHHKFTHYDFYIFQWACTIDGFRHNHKTYEWMARTLAVSDRFDALESLLQSLPSNPCPCSDGIFGCPRTESIFRFVINSYCRVGRLNDALLAFDTMKKLIDGKPSVALYNILIHGFLKNGGVDKALVVYGKMKTDRVKPDVFTYNILINGYCRNSDFKSALGMFGEMRVMGCEPNEVTFNTLIRGFFRERRFDEGVRMAYDMLEMGHKFTHVTCEILVDGLCREEGKLFMACDLLVDFANKGGLQCGCDCFALIESLCSAGNVTRALEVVNGMWQNGNAPSSITCITLIDGLIKIGNTEEALAFVSKLLKDDTVPDIVTFNCLLQDACSVGRTIEADRLRLLASSKGLDLDIMTYSILVDGYRREGRRKDGERLVDEMLEAGFIPDISTYNRLMDGLSNNRSNVPLKIAGNG